MMNVTENFIIVDDDPINNAICKKIIQKTIPPATVISFTDPEKALDYFRAERSGNRFILLLDINMPKMTGWQFLEEFIKTDGDIQNHVTVYILSSSIDLRDKEMAASNKIVKQLLLKPLTVKMLNDALEK